MKARSGRVSLVFNHTVLATQYLEQLLMPSSTAVYEGPLQTMCISSPTTSRPEPHKRLSRDPASERIHLVAVSRTRYTVYCFCNMVQARPGHPGTEPMNMSWGMDHATPPPSQPSTYSCSLHCWLTPAWLSSLQRDTSDSWARGQP
jgi:hypothetical protein